MARVRHLIDDKPCPFCHMVIQKHIPHECDPSICRTCFGKGEKWLGRDKETAKWLGWSLCPDCGGTGKRRFDSEDDAIAVA